MELTLDEILENMADLKKKYYIKATIYNEKILIGSLSAIAPKDIITKTSCNHDKMLTDLIKKIETLSHLEDIKKAYFAYKELAINELVRLSKTKTTDEMIEIYRDKMKFKWRDIGVIVGYSRSQTIEKYNKYKRSDTTGHLGVL